MIEQDFQRYRDMSPSELKGEFLTVFEMIPKMQPLGNLSGREHSAVRFALLGRLCRIMERSSFSLAGREYFEDKRFFDYWVKGFDPDTASGVGFSGILDRMRDPDFDITNPLDTKVVERAAFADLNVQLDEIRGSEPRRFLEEVEKRHEIEKLEGLSERWRYNFSLRYSEELVRYVNLKIRHLVFF